MGVSSGQSCSHSSYPRWQESSPTSASHFINLRTTHNFISVSTQNPLSNHWTSWTNAVVRSLNGSQTTLNPSKSEVLFMGTKMKLHSVGNIAKVSVTGCDISPAESIKNLGVTLDSELSLCKTSQYHIRALRHIRQSVDFETAKTIGCVVVGSHLDYCNSILYGTSAGNLKKLQIVQNALARVVSGKRKYDRITPTLIDLHWLPVAHRINFKLATIVFKNQNPPLTGILEQSTRWIQTAESTQIICRRIPCRSPHSNCSCNPGFLCSCSKTVEHYSDRHQKQFIISHI